MARLTLDDLRRLPLPGMDAPTRLAFSPDGAWLAFLHAPDGSNVQSLWRVDVVSGTRSLVADAGAAPRVEGELGREEQLRRERSRERALGITDFHWAAAAADPPLLAVPLGGDVLVARGAEPARPLGLAGASDPRLAPRGDELAWVAGGELHVARLAPDGALEGDARRLTHDARDGITNGLADYAAAEELGRSRGFWWNAGGEAIACAHVDETMVPPFHLQHLAADVPDVEVHRYPFAGGPNAHVTLRVIQVLAGRSHEVDLAAAADGYLARVVAEPSGGWLVAVLPRRQRSLRWLRVGVDGTARDLWTETAEPWLNLDDDTRVLRDGRILRSTETSGCRHLELRAADGTPERTLTTGAWVVIGVAGVDEARGEVLFHATRHGVLERHLYAVPLDAPRPVADPERRTTEPGWHETVVAAGGGHWSDRWSSLERAPTVALHGGGGAEPLVIHAPSVTPEALGHEPPELTTVMAADGETKLHAALYRPRSAPPPWPAVVWVYGGPRSQKVANHWDLTAPPWRQMMRQLGAAVLVVDNRGTAHRGLDFEAPLAGCLGEVEVADQLAALDQLALRGDLDPDRVAITGGSYGGFMAIRCLLRHPDRFRAGVAWAPVVDWEGYDTAYTERYLGTPAANPEGYRTSSLRPDAGRLRAPLLIQHGLVDENVHFRHTARLIAALDEAGVAYELQVFPTERHSSRSPFALRARDRRAIEFLARAIGLDPPRG